MRGKRDKENCWSGGIGAPERRVAGHREQSVQLGGIRPVKPTVSPRSGWARGKRPPPTWVFRTVPALAATSPSLGAAGVSAARAGRCALVSVGGARL